MFFKHQPALGFLFLLSACLSMLLTAGCASDNEPPEDLISTTEMQNLLIELHQAEGIVEMRGGPLVKRKVLRDEMYDDVLGKYGLDRVRFFESYQYYLANPIVLDSMYSQIVDSLSARLEIEQEAQRKRRKPPKKRAKKQP